MPSSSGDVLVAQVSGPIERVWLEHSYHVATLDHDAELVGSRTVEFVRDVLRLGLRRQDGGTGRRADGRRADGR